MGIFSDIFAPKPPSTAPPGFVKVGPWWVNRVTGERRPIPGEAPEGAIPDTEVDATSPWSVDIGDVGRSLSAGIAELPSAAVNVQRFGRDAALAVPMAFAGLAEGAANRFAPELGERIGNTREALSSRDDEIYSALNRPFREAAEVVGPEAPAEFGDRPLQAILEGAARSAPTTAAIMATGGGALPAAIAVESGAAYDEALSRGVSRPEAMAKGGLVGAASGLLEKYGIDSILGKVGGQAAAGYLRRAAEAMLGEGATEGAQELISIAGELATGKEIGFDEARRRVALAMGTGAASGAALSVPAKALQAPPPGTPQAPSPVAPSEDVTPGGRFREYFTANRALPEEFVLAREKARGAIKRDLMEAEFLASDLVTARDAWEKASGMSREEANEVMHRYITSPEDREESSLPAEVRGALDPMRAMLDRVAGGMIAREKLLTPGMKSTYADNLGEHIRRSYAMFDFPDWREQIRGTEIETTGKDYLREEMAERAEKEWLTGEPQQRYASFDDYLESRVEGEFGKLLDRDKNPFFALGGGGLGTLDESVMAIRKDIPKELRAAMGEIYDPAVLLTKTIERNSRTLHMYDMYEAIKESGLNEVFFPAAEGEASRALPGERFSRSPLGGMSTTPRMADLLESSFAEVHQGTYLGTLNGFVKAGYTTGSPASALRNFEGNFLPLAANGNVDPVALADGVRVAKAAEFGSTDPWARQQALDMAEYGLLGTTVHTREVEEFFGDIGRKLESKPKAKRAFDIVAAPFGAGSSKAGRLAKGFYQAMDVGPKHAAWTQERKKYAKARGLDSDDPRIKAEAAEIVKRTMQNYERVPKYAELARRGTVLAPFISFRIASAQNAINTVELAFKELKDPQLRPIGVRRLAGIVAAAAAPAAAAVAAKGLMGADWEEEDDRGMRRMLPSYVQQFVPAEIDRETGKAVVYDFGHMDYYGSLRDPILEWIRAGEVGENGAIAAMQQVWTDTFGEEIGLGTLMSASRGVDDKGRPIRNQGDGFAEKAVDTLSFIMDRFTPGWGKTVQRLAEGFAGDRELTHEALAAAGPRPYEVDVRKHGIEGGGRRWKAQVSDIEKGLDERSMETGPVDEWQFHNTAKGLRPKLDRAYRDYQQTLEYAQQRMGVSRADAAAYAEFSGVPKREVGRLLNLKPEQAAELRWQEFGERILSRHRGKYPREWAEHVRLHPDETPQQRQRQREKIEERWERLWSVFHPNDPPPNLGLSR